MPELIQGYLTEQKVSTVTNSDSDINTEITIQAEDSWVVASLTISGSDMVILFTRTLPISPP